MSANGFAELAIGGIRLSFFSSPGSGTSDRSVVSGVNLFRHLEIARLMGNQSNITILDILCV